MKRFLLAVALTCALSSVALAGDVPSTGINAEEPPIETESLGEIPSTDFASVTWFNELLWSFLSTI